MIKREKYLKQIRPFYESDLIKIVTGIRRCGKSVILKSVSDEIATKTDNILYLDFEDAIITELSKYSCLSLCKRERKANVISFWTKFKR